MSRDAAALFSPFKLGDNGNNRDLAIDAVARGEADLIAFGRPFIANPDLVERLRIDAPLNEVERATLYGGGAKYYTDCPALVDA